MLNRYFLRSRVFAWEEYFLYQEWKSGKFGKLILYLERRWEQIDLEVSSVVTQSSFPAQEEIENDGKVQVFAFDIVETKRWNDSEIIETTKDIYILYGYIKATIITKEPSLNIVCVIGSSHIRYAVDILPL